MNKNNYKIFKTNYFNIGVNLRIPPPFAPTRFDVLFMKLCAVSTTPLAAPATFCIPVPILPPINPPNF